MLLRASLIFALAGCSPQPGGDGCEALCTHAEEKFAACMDDNGTEWGLSVGFTSAQDFEDWCATYTWEERQLGRGDLCPDRQAIIDEGDCAAWYTAWADEL